MVGKGSAITNGDIRKREYRHTTFVTTSTYNSSQTFGRTDRLRKLETKIDEKTQKRDRAYRNQEDCIRYENQRQKLESRGVLCGTASWVETGTKAKIYTHLCLGQEAQRQFRQGKHNIDFQSVYKKDLWEELEDVLLQKNNCGQTVQITLQNPNKNEFLEQFHTKLL